MSLLQWLTRAGRDEILRNKLKEYEKVKKSHPTEVVLRALLAGRHIENKKRGTTFRLFNGTKLLVKKRDAPPQDKKSWSAADVPLSRFIIMCAELSGAELVAIEADTAMAEMADPDAAHGQTGS